MGDLARVLGSKFPTPLFFGHTLGLHQPSTRCTLPHSCCCFPGYSVLSIPQSSNNFWFPCDQGPEYVVAVCMLGCLGIFAMCSQDFREVSGEIMHLDVRRYQLLSSVPRAIYSEIKCGFPCRAAQTCVSSFKPRIGVFCIRVSAGAE